MYFALVGDDTSETIAVPVSPATLLPKNLPAGGISVAEIRKLSGAKVFNELVIPGPNISVYAYLRSSVHRNIFRIPLP